MKIDSQTLEKIQSLTKPTIIAISGFGGSGKTTYANLLAQELKAPVISIDGFNKRITQYSNWELFDFSRLEKEILIPFQSGKNPLTYVHNDGENEKDVEVAHDGILIVEGVGLFRPELMKYFDYPVWIDCPIEEAVKRGKKRDREVWQNPKDELWGGIWKKNDLESFEKFRPEQTAKLIVNNE